MEKFPPHQSIAVLHRAFDALDSKRTAEQVLALARLGHSEVLQAYAGHPLEDEWLDFVHESLALHVAKARGHLYCVTNPAQPGFHKIGMTGRQPAQRIAELTSAAVVGHFVLVKSWTVYDRFAVEKVVHARLAAQFPKHKEFFHGPWEALCAEVDEAISLDSSALTRANLELR